MSKNKKIQYYIDDLKRYKWSDNEEQKWRDMQEEYANEIIKAGFDNSQDYDDYVTDRFLNKVSLLLILSSIFLLISIVYFFIIK
jgi:hypothetical protein